MLEAKTAVLKKMLYYLHYLCSRAWMLEWRTQSIGKASFWGPWFTVVSMEKGCVKTSRLMLETITAVLKY